ncbi:MAG: hypothetical protein KKE57_03805 [Proteobacteria bacterium]|nr:hypothetical protein [Pseudomonadota bacterium]
MDKKYRVVFLGLLKSREEFVAKMARLGVSPDVGALIIQKAPVILKGEMTLGEARQYADAVQFAGGKVHIQNSGVFERRERAYRSLDIPPLENFTMCPECGYKQIKAGTCVKCGFIFGA